MEMYGKRYLKATEYTFLADLTGLLNTVQRTTTLEYYFYYLLNIQDLKAYNHFFKSSTSH